MTTDHNRISTPERIYQIFCTKFEIYDFIGIDECSLETLEHFQTNLRDIDTFLEENEET